jgi:subtilisin
MSLGGSSAPGALEAMCNAAWNKGLLLIAAAGNTGGTSDPGVGFPAKFAKVVAVSAINNSNTIAPFSSRGPEVELCAPGVQVLSTLPGGGHGKMSGTSMACPHVSGAAALAWGGHRFSSNVTIRRVLAKTSDNLGVPGRDDLYGYGRVDARQAACRLTPPGEVPGIP